MTDSQSAWRLALLGLLSLFLAVTGAAPAAARGGSQSAVFAAPSPEMVDVSHGLGIPFGGIGTGFSVFGKYGFVDVYFDGRRLNSREWRIDQPPGDAPTFAFQLTEGGKGTVLQTTPVAWLPDAQPVDRVQAYADLPKGHFVFQKAGADLGLVMTGFSPLTPHDLPDSTVPVQVFDVTVENKASKARALGLALRHRDALTVRGDRAVLVGPDGETAFACDGGKADAHGVGANFTLAPKQRRTVRFYIAWDYPVARTTSPAARQTYRRFYAKRFPNTDGVVALARKSAGRWSDAIDRWHAAYDAPPAFKRLWFSALCSVSTSTLLTDDPFFFEQEVPHNWVNTMDVGVYHNWLYLVNWPELERMDMDQYYRSIPRTGPDAGRVWHSLWSDNSEYAEEPAFMGRVYRDSLWFNDPAWSATGFGLATLAANHAYRTDIYQALPHNPVGNQSYDLWKMPGVNAYVSVTWVYGLYGLDRMSQTLHRPCTVGGMPAGQLFSQARRSLDTLLWNPQGGYWNTFYVPADRPEDADARTRPDAQDTFSDQLFGKWLLRIDPQAESVLPPDKVRSALMTVYTNNLVDDPAQKFRGWANGMRPGHRPEMQAGYHARTCWFGPQEDLASLLADEGDEARSLDVFDSLESSLHDDDLFVGEWNKSVGPDGLSRVLPEEPNKDTPRFPPYPRFKSCWEYLLSILGLKMDAQNFTVKPFQTIRFALHDVELAGTRFTVTVQPGWTTVRVNGRRQTGPVRFPRSLRAVTLEFIK